MAASGKLVNAFCVLAIRVCIPRHDAQVHLATKVEKLQVWHERLGHQNKQRVMQVLKQHGINMEGNKYFCDGCALEKAQHKRFGTRTSRPSVVVEQINADVCGPMRETSVGGVRYYVCSPDDYSKYRRVLFIATKSEVVDCLQKFLKDVKPAVRFIKVLLSDDEKKFIAEAVESVLEEYGIAPNHHAIYSRTERCSRATKLYNCGKHSLSASRQWIAERTVGWGQ